MADIHYYLSVYPTEALIASQLGPEQFGAYMATGSNKGSAEKIVFIELSGEFGDHFDWAYAHEKCVPHASGDPKHSVYLSVYRVLEVVPLEKLGSMYLTTRDGRSLALTRGGFEQTGRREFYLYQEICPLTPLVVSTLAPADFARYITGTETKIRVPKILFADLKVIDFDRPDKTGNIGPLYDRNIEHMKDCIRAVTTRASKPTKTLERSHLESFSYQTIDRGFYVSDGREVVMYRMPGFDELNDTNRDWLRSAQMV